MPSNALTRVAAVVEKILPSKAFVSPYIYQNLISDLIESCCFKELNSIMSAFAKNVFELFRIRIRKNTGERLSAN
jgi:hypothetical protein